MITVLALRHGTPTRQVIVEYVTDTEQKSAMAVFSQLQVASQEKKRQGRFSLSPSRCA